MYAVQTAALLGCTGGKKGVSVTPEAASEGRFLPNQSDFARYSETHLLAVIFLQ
jgi:hypothetical protein